MYFLLLDKKIFYKKYIKDKKRKHQDMNEENSALHHHNPDSDWIYMRKICHIHIWA